MEVFVSETIQKDVKHDLGSNPAILIRIGTVGRQRHRPGGAIGANVYQQLRDRYGGYSS